MTHIPRRRFLSTSVAAGALALSANSRVLGAGDRVRLALVGAGGRGSRLAEMFAARKDAEVTHVCDLHEGRRIAAVKKLAAQQGREPIGEPELQRLLERKEVDAVIVATPDHWHALATIWACQAGKDVYVEKPPSHTLWEGRQMVKAARKYKRIVQVGTQNRSAPYNLAAREFIASGKLGTVHLCKVFNLKSGGPFRLPANDKPPEGFDWNAWLGPAALRPHNSRIFRGGWHKYWDFSGGDMGDDGIHQIDLARMLLGDPPAPRRVHGSAGRYAYPDDREVPDTQVVTFEYPKMLLTFELTNYPPYMDKIAQAVRNADRYPYWSQCATRIEIYGSKGLMIMGRHGGGWQVFGKAKRQSDRGELIAQMPGRPGDDPHQSNFLTCIKSRETPTADIDIGHQSVLLVHLGNIAHRAGNRQLNFDPDTERFQDCEEANALIRHTDRKEYAIPERV
jgi:predicted dehydrogenase